MEDAIAPSNHCISEAGAVSPKVRAVVVKDGVQLAVAWRGQDSPGEREKLAALEKKLGSAGGMTDATVYTTLEPCTSRGHPRVPCACD